MKSTIVPFRLNLNKSIFLKKNAYFRLLVNLTGPRKDRYIRNARKPSASEKTICTKFQSDWTMGTCGPFELMF